jgi:hypothetical protein
VGNQLKVRDAPADRQVALMHVDHATELLALFLSARTLDEQILILREQHSPKFRGPVEQCRVLESPSTILLCGQYIDRA